jgi:hypothetical protein
MRPTNRSSYEDLFFSELILVIMKTLLLFVVLILGLASCRSNSSNRAVSARKEKVIVIHNDSYDLSTSLFKYKVRRPEKGVVDFIYDPNSYAIGDTIMHVFN